MSGPIGCDTGFPIAVQLISNLVQVPIRAAAAVVGSVADAVSSASGSLEQWSCTTHYQQPTPPYSTKHPSREGYTVNVTDRSSRPWRSARSAKVIEGDESYFAHVEVPIADPADISVRVAQNHIEVVAKTASETGFDQYTSITIPDGVDHENISADYRDGILTIRMPKEASRVRREVKVHSGAAAKPAAPKPGA
jgi:HSP20 family molecular chaperone IbpA